MIRASSSGFDADRITAPLGTSLRTSANDLDRATCRGRFLCGSHLGATVSLAPVALLTTLGRQAASESARTGLRSLREPRRKRDPRGAATGFAPWKLHRGRPPNRLPQVERVSTASRRRKMSGTELGSGASTRPSAAGCYRSLSRGFLSVRLGTSSSTSTRDRNERWTRTPRSRG